MKTATVLNTPLSITSYRRLAGFCFAAAANGRHGGPLTVGFTDLNALFLRKKDDAFKELTDGAIDLFVPDGASLKLLLAAKGIPFEEHLTGDRFMRHCCVRSPGSVRHFLLGGTPDDLARLSAFLQRHNARLHIVGVRAAGFLRSEEKSVVDEINRCEADILWNCLPTPEQEAFTSRWKSALTPKLNLLIGAGFDFAVALARGPQKGHAAGRTLRRVSVVSRRFSRRWLRGTSRHFTFLSTLFEGWRATGIHTPWGARGELTWRCGRRARCVTAEVKHRLRLWARGAAKRLLDVVGGLFLLLLLSPVLVVTALIIWMVDGRPVTFSQRRVGQDGRVFKLLKFRTMRRDAELLPAMASAHKIEGDEHLFKDPHSETILKLRKVLLQHSRSTKYPRDPRIIRFGRFIRRYSLDELPQLLHIIRGDLSLVGPRPFSVLEVAEYGPRHLLRHKVKPGLTGPWQVSDRNKLTFEESIGLDLRYIREQSFWLDLKILLQTIPAAFKNRGGE